MPGPTPRLHPSDPAAAPVSARGGGGLARAARGALVATWLGVTLAHLALPAAQRIQVWPLGYLLLEILAFLSLSHRAWRAPSGERMAWLLLAVSAFFEVPSLLLTFSSHGQAVPEIIFLVSLLSLATGILALAGVLSFPKEPGPGSLFRRRALDSLIFATSLLFLLLAMGVQGSLRASSQGMGLRVLAAYLNAALLGGGLVFMTSYHPGLIRGPLGWLSASALAWLSALSCWALAGLPSVTSPHAWIALAGGIPFFQGLAAWSPQPEVSRASRATDGKRLVRLFPYLPVLAAILVLAALLPRGPLELMRGAIGAFLLMVALLLLRQFLAILDLRAARRTLEERVQHRTEALEHAQEALLRTERMNTLALMGAGLAHDLNNLLSVLKSSAELALMNLEEGRPVGSEDLQRMTSAASRAATLTSRLMRFVSRESEDLAPVDLGQELRDMEATLRLLIPRTVELCIDVAPAEALIVQSSRLRLEQMLVNLVANARDAMPEGGKLAIRAGADGPEAAMARIDVVDSGIGMPPEILDRIFDPFFTTKAPGKGTGLGLPSLKALVEEGEGRMEVASEPGKGSRFTIFLPRLNAL